MIFFNSALNPLVYGYGNETMQKAFKITFPWIFKEKPDFVLKKGHGQSTFIFAKIVQKHDTKLNKTIKSIGEEVMIPITGHWEKGPMVRPRSRSKMGILAKRVVRKASVLAGPPKKSSPISRSDGNVSNSKLFVKQD